MPVLDFDQAFLLHGDLAPDPVPPAASPRRTGLADKLGIRRTSVLREHRGITSGTVRTMRISLSKGDGSSGWTCDLHRCRRPGPAGLPTAARSTMSPTASTAGDTANFIVLSSSRNRPGRGGSSRPGLDQ